MKNLLLSATTALITILSSGHVLAGGEASGGNGDGVFALQTLQRKNPYLEPYEILLKAFEEARGRVPKQFKYHEGNCPSELSGNWECASLLRSQGEASAHSFVIDLSSRPQRVLENDLYSFADLILVRKPGSTGPLLGDRATGKPALLHSKVVWGNSRREYPAYGFLENSPTGLKGYMDPDIHAGWYDKITDKSQANLEFRQYNKNIVVFVEYPVLIKSEKGHVANRCLGSTRGYEGEYTPLKSSRYCAVGYYWID
jgi:hypothetical protein